ncbi:colanic acid biosynthesis glycosyltransferase WcaL [Hydrogenophaga crassostreae]|uniref:Colanic acid biosynthesis glycosyltransferase WcaL n=1 Tax=Hydrogenophaga crassostreae TaxID=1763535 RepID=A0A167HVI5_9BURK|nr:glycosyltransferase family 4 protein [Hydrogenophaga crassostreae]AOW13502.1 colanic acid biosynthesis glycosyltransferase WcaL [Hydrogenophaga crassostreae]OAD41793.1 colanic acid biosynthesis glycosyltransferase WcaL [Hydrogenophaga crassostreae]
MRVAYFTNQYPKVSHSFIRREILALERQGVEVARLALRGWSDGLVDPDDLSEREKTHYLLRGGLGALLPATIRQLLSAPVSFLQGVRMALRLSRLSDRPAPYHLVYLAEACELVHWCRQQGVDHLHVHFGTNPAEVALLARLIGGPAYSFTVHGPDEFDRPLGLHLREKIEAASHVVAISSYGRSQLYRWVGHSHWHKIQVVHCGLETSFFDPPPSQPFPSTPRLVCVGRLCEQKGQLLLLDAVRRLRDRGEDFHLVLAGDGEMRRELEAFIAQHNLQAQVSITGWISSERVKQELLAARTMVLASFAEGLPVVIMEAMALGRPVLTTSIAGIPELVRHGVDGWLVPAGDVEALVETLSSALATPAAQLEQMGLTARARVIERHSIDTEAAKLKHLLPAPS